MTKTKDIELKCLLGTTVDNEIVFGEFGITYRNNYPQFTASFDTVAPINDDDFDLVEYFDDFLDSCDGDYKWKLCEYHDCKPSELAECLADECCDVRDALDCSVYPKRINVDGEHYCFESRCGGQHDTRDEMEFYCNKQIYDKIHQLWDKYHLKKVDDSVVDEVKDLISTCKTELPDEVEYITNYIREHLQ